MFEAGWWVSLVAPYGLFLLVLIGCFDRSDNRLHYLRVKALVRRDNATVFDTVLFVRLPIYRGGVDEPCELVQLGSFYQTVWSNVPFT